VRYPIRSFAAGGAEDSPDTRDTQGFVEIAKPILITTSQVVSPLNSTRGALSAMSTIWLRLLKFISGAVAID